MPKLKKCPKCGGRTRIFKVPPYSTIPLLTGRYFWLCDDVDKCKNVMSPIEGHANVDEAVEFAKKDRRDGEK